MDYLLTKEISGPIITICSALLVYMIIKNILNRTIIKLTLVNRKQKTILNLIKNVLKYILLIVVLLVILGIYGINTSQIIAGLGIAGVVIGFALQDILKDFFAGITIIIDNQYSIGDNVEINGFKGNVISLGLRSTKIKNDLGEIKIISNRNILEVTNLSLNSSSVLIELSVSSSIPIDKVEKTIDECLNEIRVLNNVIGGPKFLGIDKLSGLTIVYSILIECKTMEHIKVKREANKIIKTTFDKNKITMM